VFAVGVVVAGCSGSGRAIDPRSPDAEVDALTDRGVDGGSSQRGLVWRLLTAPDIGVDGITRIWGSSSTDIYFGTENGNVFHLGANGVWNGTAAGIGPVTAIWGSGPNDVYAATLSGSVGVVHSVGNDVWASVHPGALG
jgi:hypothetical protein